MSTLAPFTLIIPAHNEEAVIARCLKAAVRGAPDPDALEIVVAANGCVDNTASIARQTLPHAKVLEIDRGSKTGAINAANEVASYFPRIVLDADVECEFAALAALAAELRKPGVMTAAPAIRLELSHGNWFIRAYYAAWMRQPFARSGKGGAGCYGLSQAAIQRINQCRQ